MELSRLFDGYNYVILTGKEGINIRDAIDQVRNALSGGDRVLVVFGSPYHGVDEILRLRVWRIH